MHKLVVIEDDAHIANIIVNFGQRRGYTVLWAADGQAGLELARAERPDVLLIDIMLPKLDGRDVLAKLHGEPWLASGVVLFLTARDQQYDRLVGLELGADDYVTKPVIMDNLFTKIDHMLEKKRRLAQ